MKFKIIIIFTNQNIQRLVYEDIDIHGAINHSINEAKECKERRVIETIMVEFLGEGLEV
jgi:hypothetical protein